MSKLYLPYLISIPGVLCCSLFCLHLLRVTLYDYQALCWVYSESSDSGHTLLNVSSDFDFPHHSKSLFEAHTKQSKSYKDYNMLIFVSLALLRFLLSLEVDPD